MQQSVRNGQLINRQPHKRREAIALFSPTGLAAGGVSDVTKWLPPWSNIARLGGEIISTYHRSMHTEHGANISQAHPVITTLPEIPVDTQHTHWAREAVR